MSAAGIGAAGKYLHDGAMSVFVGRYLPAERAETRQAGSRV